MTPGAPPWARAAPGRYHGTMQRNERCLGGRPGVKSPGRRQNCPAPDGGGDQGEVHFRQCTHRTSSSCRPRCHRWPCDTATEPQLVRLRRVRLCAAMCRTWEGRFSLQGCDDHGGCSGCMTLFQGRFRLFSYTPTLSNPYLATHTHSSTHRDAARCQGAPQHPRQLAECAGNAYQPYRITVKSTQTDQSKTVSVRLWQMI